MRGLSPIRAPLSKQIGWGSLPKGSDHADPLRPVHADRKRRAAREVKGNPARERTTIVDDDGDGPAGLWIGNRHLRAEGQRSMRGRIPAAVEGVAARSPPARGVVSRNHVLPRTGSMRPGVREEPGEASTVGLAGRYDEQRRGQSDNSKTYTHGSYPFAYRSSALRTHRVSAYRAFRSSMRRAWLTSANARLRSPMRRS